jgi:multisubunit Na+/H+ antiporter MnhF subunit
MTYSILQIAALGLMGLAVVLSALRFFMGPSTPDRVVAADTLAIITTAGLVGLASIYDNPIYLDIALVYGTLAFVGTVALARAIEGNRS